MIRFEQLLMDQGKEKFMRGLIHASATVLVSRQALAADLPRPIAPAFVPSPVSTCSGIYIGVRRRLLFRHDYTLPREVDSTPLSPLRSLRLAQKAI
jgi:hypothetical protein